MGEKKEIMIQVFVFEDKANDSYDPLASPRVFRTDINRELEKLQEDRWNIKSVQHQILVNYCENHTTFDKNVFTVVATHY